MDTSIKPAAWIITLALLASCSDGPSASPDLTIGLSPVITHQSGDLTVSCDGLQGEINDIGSKMLALDKQIALHPTQHQPPARATFGVLGKPDAPAAQPNGATSTRLTARPGGAGSQLDTRQLKANYTRRHQALMKIYFARCVLG